MATDDGDPLDALGTDAMAQALLGENMRRAGSWLYIQEQTRSGTVAFVGASRLPPGRPATAHPLRYGSTRTHQFIVGELLLRPTLVVATDALAGTGLAGLATGDHDVNRMLRQGEILLGRWGG